MKADKLALIKLNEESKFDQSLWWNKMKNMTDEEEEFLPYSFVKKYGTFSKNILENSQWTRIDEAKDFEDRWLHIKDLDKLLTNSEKAEIAEFKRFNLEQGENHRENYEMTDYMKRQPRANLRDKNFNFEQFSEYSDIYEEAREKDEKHSKDFYKLVKYVLKNREAGPSNLIVRDFLKKYKLDLIEIP